MYELICTLALVMAGAPDEQSGTPFKPPSNGQTTPTLELDPPQIVVKPGQPFHLRAKTASGRAFFDVSNGITAAPEDWPLADKKLVFYGFAPNTMGNYAIAVTVYGNDDRKIVTCPVIVTNDPKPGPGPGPSPGPTDPLVADLTTEYSKDGSPADDKSTLSGVYRSGAKAVIRLKQIDTVGHLFKNLKDTVELEFPDDKRNALTNVRKRLEIEHRKHFPSTMDTKLTDEMRKETAAYFNKVADALDAVK